MLACNARTLTLYRHHVNKAQSGGAKLSARAKTSTSNAADALGMAHNSLAFATALMTNAGSEQDAHEGSDHLLWHDGDEPSVLPKLP